MRGIFYGLILVSLFLGGYTSSRADDVCNRAEDELDGLTNWQRIYEAYKKYPEKCDDGSVAEGYSDVVATLLTEHWESVDDLARLARPDPGFEKFVLRHVDEMMTQKQARIISTNANERCPTGSEEICRSLEAQLAQ